MANRRTQMRNRNLTNPIIPAVFTAKQRRFLDAYAARPWEVAEAARVAGCHRCSVYRWREESPAFRAAMRESEDAERRREWERYDTWKRAKLAEWKAEAEARAAAARTMSWRRPRRTAER